MMSSPAAYTNSPAPHSRSARDVLSPPGDDQADRAQEDVDYEQGEKERGRAGHLKETISLASLLVDPDELFSRLTTRRQERTA